MKTPPKPAELRAVLKMLKTSARRIMKARDPVYVRLGLNDPTLTEGALINALADHPHLLDGPLVVTEDDAVIARPPEKVFNVL